MDIYDEIYNHVKNGESVLMYVETDTECYPVKLRLITPVSCEYTWTSKQFETSCFSNREKNFDLQYIITEARIYDKGYTKITYEIL